MEHGLTRNEVIQMLAKSPHGDLTQYVDVVTGMAAQDGDFLSHYIAWDSKNGQIRDAHVGLPLISLGSSKFEDPEFIENSLAHLAQLSPRELLQAYMFAKGYVRNSDKAKGGWVKAGVTQSSSPVTKIATPRGVKRIVDLKPFTLGAAGRMNTLDRLVAQYLRAREVNHAWFLRTVMNFRRPLIKLYFLSHTMPSLYAKQILYDKILPVGSCLEAVKHLVDMSPIEAAGAIIAHKIPFLVINSTLRKKAKDPMILMAMIDRMSPTELQTNMSMLEKMGVKDHAETRVALDKALGRAANSKKTTLKTTRAAEKVQDEGLRDKLRDLQERQMTKIGKIEGNWAVLVDKSGSMQSAIETGRHVAAFLAKMVQSKVYLVFFDVSPIFYDVTGKSYEEIAKITRNIQAQGGTSIGCGLATIRERKLDIDGIAIISDGGENALPYFGQEYKKLLASSDKEVPVYFYHVVGSSADIFSTGMKAAGYNMTKFELGRSVDYYSIPGLAKTMSTKVYGLVQEIMDTPLLKLSDVFKEASIGA